MACQDARVPTRYELRPLRVEDPVEVQAVLTLNNAAVPAVNALTADRLGALAEMAAHAEVVIADETTLAGLVVVLPAGAPYDSPLFGWFAERYQRYLYLDRIVVHPDFRRQGVGRFVYDRMEQRAASQGRLLCEVNLDPPNPESQAFHAARGYVEVGRLVVPGSGTADKECRMLAKELE